MDKLRSNLGCEPTYERVERVLSFFPGTEQPKFKPTFDGKTVQAALGKYAFCQLTAIEYPKFEADNRTEKIRWFAFTIPEWKAFIVLLKGVFYTPSVEKTTKPGLYVVVDKELQEAVGHWPKGEPVETVWFTLEYRWGNKKWMYLSSDKTKLFDSLPGGHILSEVRTLPVYPGIATLKLEDNNLPVVLPQPAVAKRPRSRAAAS